MTYRANDHRANGNRADVVAPSFTAKLIILEKKVFKKVKINES